MNRMKNLASGMKVVWVWIRYILTDALFDHGREIIDYETIVDIEKITFILQID